MWFFDLNPDGVKALTGLDVNTPVHITLPQGYVEVPSMNLFSGESFDFVRRAHIDANDTFYAICYVLSHSTKTVVAVRTKKGKPYLKKFVSLMTVKVTISVRLSAYGFTVRINDALYNQQWFSRRLSIVGKDPADLARSVIQTMVGLAQKSNPAILNQVVKSNITSFLN